MRRFFKLSVAIVLIGVAPLVCFHWRYEEYALSLISEKHLHDEKANALKHAVAAAEVYRAMAAVMGEHRAELFTLRLGTLNEYLEQTVRFRNLDTPAELFKDMANNQIGITTAQWQLRTNPLGDLRQTLLLLAQADGVIPSGRAVTLPAPLAGMQSYEAIRNVHRMFEEKRETIIAQTLEKLGATAP